MYNSVIASPEQCRGAKQSPYVWSMRLLRLRLRRILAMTPRSRKQKIEPLKSSTLSIKFSLIVLVSVWRGQRNQRQRLYQNQAPVFQ